MQQPFSYTTTHPYTCNKALYIVMALLFGSWGMHKFCAGRVGMGILYLSLSLSGMIIPISLIVIPMALGVIEGILAMFKPADSLGAIAV